MKINIIYGIRGIKDAMRVAIRSALAKNGCEVVDDRCTREIKSGIDQMVDAYARPEQLVLILSDVLEPQNPFTIRDLLRYQRAVPDVKIIVVVGSAERGSELLKEMSDNGMYLALYDTDTSPNLVSSLIVSGRSAAEAKRYYGVENAANVSKRLTIEGAVRHMTQPVTSVEEYPERARWIRGALFSEDMFVEFVHRLPDGIKEVLSREKEYVRYVEDYILAKDSRMEKGVSDDCEGRKGKRKKRQERHPMDREGPDPGGTDFGTSGGKKQGCHAEGGRKECEAESSVIKTRVKNALGTIRRKSAGTTECPAVTGWNNGKGVISIYSLRHSVGTSYLAAAVANHLAEDSGRKVALVLNDLEYVSETVRRDVQAVSWTRDVEAYAVADYIVYDVGVYDELSADRRRLLARSDLQVLLCKGDGNFLSKLAQHVETRQMRNVAYLFNEIPPQWEKKVRALMDFTESVYFLPTIYALSPARQTAEFFDLLLRKG